MNRQQQLQEMLKEEVSPPPPWYDENDYTEALPFSLSLNQFSNYKFLKEYPDNIKLIQRNDKLAFVLGKLVGDHFVQYILLRTTLPRTGSPKTIKNSLQIDLVLASDKIKNSGLAKLVYKEIISRYVLISDFEQHGRAKDLWKAVSNMNDIFVYVWDGMSKDYIRENGKIKRYKEENISDDEIWGKDVKHMSRVLVASNKEITR